LSNRFNYAVPGELNRGNLMKSTNTLRGGIAAFKSRVLALDATSVMMLLLLCLLLAHNNPAFAQIPIGGAGDDGSGVWTKIKSLIYGPPGLIVGSLFLIWAIKEWVDQGFKASIGVVLAVLFIFLVPAIVSGFQSFGKSQS
jgi:hypothetical protein